MKKLLLVVMTVLMSSVSFAQVVEAQKKCLDLTQSKATATVPSWRPLGTPFVATTITGETVDLQAILDQGYSVVIDYSCCWCGPCYQVHRAGIMEAIDALDSVVAIWIECESSNTTDQIYGIPGSGTYGSTQGNWTVNANGDPITYPIIDDASCLNTCMSLYANAVPYMVFIAPSGYYCSIYGEDYGISVLDAATCAQNVQSLRENSPEPNSPAIIDITGPSIAFVDQQYTFEGIIVSIDDVTSVEWAATNGTPATGTGNTFTTSWLNAGPQTVTLTVTNTTGTSTINYNVNVRDTWNWGAEMTYAENGSLENAYNTGSGITWASRYPAQYMAGRKYIDNVKVYSRYATTATLKIYQTQSGATPTNQDLIYQHDHQLTASNTYLSFPMTQEFLLDETKDLWVAFTSALGNGAQVFPATGTTYCGDPNGSYVGSGSSWDYIFNVGGAECTWMMSVTTSDTPNVVNIDEVNSASVQLYPNPTTSVLNIAAEGIQEVSVSDINGRNVMTAANVNTIDMSELANGIYFVRVITNKGVSTQKIVKK